MDLYCLFFTDCQGYKDIIQLIIDRGANVNDVDKDGNSALEAALEAGDSDGTFKTNFCL